MTSNTPKRNASSSHRGWEFQVNSAIVLFLRNVADVSAVRVEGLEDVELVFGGGKKLYAQAKMRATRNPGDGSTRRFSEAMKTLAEDLRLEDCARVVYVTNDEYPFGRSPRTAMFGDDSCFRYDELPDSVRDYVAKTAGQVGVSEQDLERFEVLVIGFYGDDDRTRHRIVLSYVQSFLGEMFAPSTLINPEEVRRTWDYLFSSNASASDVTLTVKKAQLAWPLVAMVCKASEEDSVFEDYDDEVRDEVLQAYRQFLDKCSDRFSLITRVNGDFNDFKALRGFSRIGDARAAFVSECWKRYSEEIGVQVMDDERAELLAKVVLRKILIKRNAIMQVKKGFNLEN